MIYIIETKQTTTRKFAVEAKNSKAAVEFVTGNLDSADFFAESTGKEEAVKVEEISEDIVLDYMADEMGVDPEDPEDEYWSDEVLETYINVVDEE